VANHILARDKNAVLLVLPSDHLILNNKAFFGIIEKGVELANRNFLITLGIVPSHPDTGYGYIKGVKKCIGKKIVCSAEKFIEKPSLKKAEEFLKSKDYFWNSGIFIWRADVILEEIKKYLPQLFRKLEKIKNAKNIIRHWKAIKPISVDFGILERSKRVLTIPANIGWTDLGSWDALSQVLKKDKNANVFKADSLDIGSKNIFVWGKDRLIATVGLKDLILIDTPDALLACRKNLSQNVKDIVELLKKHNREERIMHKTVQRPWGSYTVLNTSKSFSAAADQPPAGR
jgi:Mannose-1-phosphate guanylyltransferase